VRDHSADDPCDICRRREWAKRSPDAQENPSFANRWAHPREIGQHCVANILRQRQPGSPPALAVDTQQPIRPIDVGDSKPADLTGTQSKSRQEKKDRSIAAADRRGQVAGLDDLLDYGWTGVARECSEAAPRC
jgi:hypothetical protein